MLHRPRVLPAVLFGPAHADETRRVHFAVPRLAFVKRFHFAARRVVFKPFAHLPDKRICFARQHKQWIGGSAYGRLAAFHLNDSKMPCGSRVDRHDTVGEGLMGKAFWKTLMNDRRFDEKFGILETPEGPESWKREIKWLRGLRE